jgi:allantoicase
MKRRKKGKTKMAYKVKIVKLKVPKKINGMDIDERSYKFGYADGRLEGDKVREQIDKGKKEVIFKKAVY